MWWSSTQKRTAGKKRQEHQPGSILYLFDVDVGFRAGFKEPNAMLLADLNLQLKQQQQQQQQQQKQLLLFTESSNDKVFRGQNSKSLQCLYDLAQRTTVNPE